MGKSSLSTFSTFLLYRLSSVVLIQTFYVPDEYWQSLEVAHNMVFGYGYLTWEWREGLRSYLYPFFFAVIFKILEFLNLDFSYLIIILPRIFQAILTAVSDQYFVLLCQKFGFEDYWAKVYIFTNWFWYYCGCRTITNTFETSFTIIALYYYPWRLFLNEEKEPKKHFEKRWSDIKEESLKYMTLAGVNCVVRPTAVTIWGPLFVFHVFSMSSKNLKQLIICCILPVFLAVMSASLLIDFFWYDKMIVPPYNFLVFNIFKKVSSFYGTHPVYWYISQGLPVVLGLQYLPFALLGLVLGKSRSDLLRKIINIWLFILALNIIILSIIPHKEFRFLLPLLPFMMLIVVKISSDFFTSSQKTQKMIWTMFLSFGFIILGIMFGIIHQRGPLKVMDYLRSVTSDCSPKCSFLFLMPCHSTPLYSHLHVNVTMRFLTCEPPLTDSHYDESDHFFKNPIEWLDENWDDKNPPTHIILFQAVDKFIGSYLKGKGFDKKQKFFHTMFPEKNRGRYILVYEPY